MISNFQLISNNVDVISESITAFFEKYSIASDDITRIRLTAEECMNRYLDAFGENVSVSLRCEKRFSEVKVSIYVRASELNPLLIDDEFKLINRLMQQIAVTPVWSYRGGRNVITFVVRQKKKISTAVYYILAVAFGIVGGLLAKSISPIFCVELLDKFLMPISDVIIGFIGSLSVIMVFTSVVSGIVGVGDIKIFKKIGVKMILRFIMILTVCGVFVTGISLLFFPIENGTSASVDVSALWRLIVDIVPTNIFRAFSTGNVLQIIFISVLCGIAILILLPRTSFIAEWMDNCNMLVQKVLQIAVMPMPILVFISLFKIVSVEETADYFSVYQYVLIMTVCCIAMVTFSVLRVSIKQKISLALLIKKLFPTFLIAISTASSSAAYTTNVDTCENRFGIDKAVCKIGIPLGQIIFKPCTVFQPICGCLCFAQLYGISLSMSQIIMLVFTVLILAVAEPPVPGVLVCCFTLLFMQIGVPSEALSIILTLECILDRLGTSTNLLSLQTELIQFADSVSMLDKDTLRKE